MTGLTAFNFNDFNRLFVGFDRLNRDLADRVANNPLTDYPRYNLVSLGEDEYRIDMTLPGWSKDDIEVEQLKNTLSIKGINKLTGEEKETFVHKGLSGKPFKREFTLGSWVEVDASTYKDGMLSVHLSVNIPAEEKPRKINIE